jgi:hypothetical protein
VVHLAEDGSELWRDDTFVAPTSVCVDPTNGSCWVADSAQVVHLSEEGEVLWRMEGFGWPWAVSTNASDGSYWVTDTLHYDSGAGWLVHLAEDGTELWRGGGFGTPWSVSVDPSDGSCWVGHWLSDESSVGDSLVRHLAEDGGELWRGTEFSWPLSLSTNSTDGSCWVADGVVDTAASTIVHLAGDGTELWRGTGFGWPNSVSVDSSDGSCWVSDQATTVIHLGEGGAELWRGGHEFSGTFSVSANSSDGSCWVTDCNFARSPDTISYIVHLGRDGTTLWRGEGPVWCAYASVNSADGSCWIAAPCDGYVSLLAEDGSELWRGDDFVRPSAVSANPTDNSCWVVDGGTSQVVRLVIQRPALFGDVPGDFWAYDEIGACDSAGIVSGYEDGTYDPSGDVDRAQMAVYIARAMVGGEENIPEAGRPRSFFDVPRDHWAFDHIEYLKAAGVVTGYTSGLYAPDLSVLRDQMAVYIARASGWVTNGDDMTGTSELFPDVPAGHWAGAAIQECLDRGVVQGYDDGCYHPEIVVTRDQMAVYMARAFDL